MFSIFCLFLSRDVLRYFKAKVNKNFNPDALNFPQNPV